ncbi:hypothetical protein [Glacieibacterium frigidum]|uniref:Uncharacterized protein n=1 Tax=Glacieibacterium frigidum TaxID=2593303 RepID=A0A552UGZ2_9SPHN|nr:hypothetical protein [Glacieibacterium frigidum]TRW17486.1 hypothetical protein FMM06_04830 [Glacieibacterium frigidum]
MPPTLRYSLTGIAALAALSGVHAVRDAGAGDNWLMGIAPNLCAAVAIPFVALGIWVDQRRDAGRRTTLRAFAWCAAGSLSGLVVWELVQRSTSGLVFDPWDLLATVVGTGLAAALIVVLAPAERPQ